MSHIFFSYAHENMRNMHIFRDALRVMDLEIWTDEDLNPGSREWTRVIKEKIQAAICVVVLLSPEAEQSEWVNIEISMAVDFDVPIIPVLTRGDQTNAIPARLVNYQRIDALGNHEKSVQLLENAIGQVIKSALHDWKQTQKQQLGFQSAQLKYHIGANAGYKAMADALNNAKRHVQHVVLSASMSRDCPAFPDYEQAVDKVARQLEYSYVADINDEVRWNRIKRFSKLEGFTWCGYKQVPDWLPIPNFMIVDGEVLFINFPRNGLEPHGLIEIHQNEVAERFQRYFDLLANKCLAENKKLDNKPQL